VLVVLIKDDVNPLSKSVLLTAINKDSIAINPNWEGSSSLANKIDIAKLTNFELNCCHIDHNKAETAFSLKSIYIKGGHLQHHQKDKTSNHI
jgi:hypothetical protein